MIHGVILKELKVIPDERGRLMEVLRADDPFFRKFGQAYVTTVYPGVVKAWHAHARQTDHIAAVSGAVRFGLYDDREGSPTRGEVMDLVIGEHRPLLVVVPPGVWHGFKGVGTKEAILVNVPSEPYDRAAPDELRKDPHGGEIPFDWARKDG
jgi:dTDP-4-dehydrorhamnose 3,5-epimerase